MVDYHSHVGSSIINYDVESYEIICLISETEINNMWRQVKAGTVVRVYTVFDPHTSS
jgi:hypothetical protein